MVQESANTKYDTPPDEISIKLFLKIVISYCHLILRRWYIVLFTCILFAVYEYKNIVKIKETYPAKIKIFIRPQDIAKENALLIKVFAQLITSRTLLDSLFMQEVEIEGTKKLLVNHYLRYYFEHKPLDLNPDIPFAFRIKHKKLHELELKERQVLNWVIDKTLTPVGDFKDGFITINADFDLGFITISISTPSEALSLTIIDGIYKSAMELLKSSSVFAQNKAYVNISNETDSLSIEYKKAYLKLNDYYDRRERELKNEKPDIKNIKYLEKKLHQQEIKAELSKTSYLAALEQTKAAQIALDQKALLIHELERTSLPIKPYRPSSKVAAIKFGIVGGFLALFLIVLSRIILNIKEELK